jgi:hypothetical protein
VHPLSSLAEQTFSRLAHLRHARALHPRGAMTAGTLTVDDPASVLARALGPGPRPVVVRLSRGLGVPPPLPDVHGVAVRFDAYGGRVDLLFSGTSRHQSTLLPYRSDTGLLWLELTRRSETDFVVRERTLPAVAASRTVGRLEVGEPTADDGSPFDPYVNRHPDLHPVAFLSRIREAAYDGSRRGRSD